jgi:hypothetical protein
MWNRHAARWKGRFEAGWTRCRSGAGGFLLHELAGEGEALAALGAAAEPGIRFALAADAAAGNLANLGFTQGIAGADDHAQSLCWRDYLRLIRNRG